MGKNDWGYTCYLSKPQSKGKAKGVSSEGEAAASCRRMSLEVKKNTYDAASEEGTTNPVFVNPNEEENFNENVEDTMNLDAIGEDEEGTAAVIEKQPWMNIPMVAEEHFEDLPQDEDGAYILIPTTKCLKLAPDILYQPSYKNWGDVKRLIVIFIALVLIGVFGWQCSPVFAAAFAAPALLWQPLILMICCLGIPAVLIMRALWPNIVSPVAFLEITTNIFIYFMF